MIEWRPVNERITVANFKHTFGKLHVVAAYAPTDAATTAQKDAFCAQLDQVTSSYHTGLVLCLGDFNNVPGDDRSLAPQLTGPILALPMTIQITFSTSVSATVSASVAHGSGIQTSIDMWYSNDRHTAREIDHPLDLLECCSAVLSLPKL